MQGGPSSPGTALNPGKEEGGPRAGDALPGSQERGRHVLGSGHEAVQPAGDERRFPSVLTARPDNPLKKN